MLTRADVLEAHKFDDAVCRSSWPIEDHSQGNETIRLHLPGDAYYQVPYRCLVPLERDNLLIAGRCISATHDGQASVRVMGPGMVIGEAAGTAAALSLREGTTPRALAPQALRQALLRRGALI